MISGMRHSSRDSGLIKACASAHGVSERSVRQWRAKDDPRWNTFLVSRARTAELPMNASVDISKITPADEEFAALEHIKQ